MRCFTRRGSIARSLRLMLPLVGLAVVLLACGFGIVPQRGASTPPVTHSPAAKLRLQIQISGQYGDRQTSDPVMLVQVSDDTGPSQKSLPPQARLTCNGVSIKPMGLINGHACPRQPPGGAYHIVYTDEHNASASFTIPVPEGTFAIVSPHDGSAVHIPTDGALAVHYTMPRAPTNGTITIDSLVAACSISPAEPCGAVFANQHPDTTPTPLPGQPTATVYEYRGAPTPTPKPAIPVIPSAPPATPRPTVGPPIPTVTTTQNGTNGVVTLTGDFNQFQPAPGTVEMSAQVQITPEQHDFAAIAVTYYAILTNHITWVR